MPDPRAERALEDLFARERLSRRRFLGRAGGAGLALSGLSAVLAACGGVEGTSEDAEERRKNPAQVNHPRTEIGEWTFSNWPLYMDKKLIRRFNREYGGDCRYLEEINDVFEFYGRVRQQLEQGVSIERDLVVWADYIISRLIRLAYLEPIDWDNVPNSVNLVEELKTINYDPDREYTLPYQSGALGIGYDIERTGRELTSMQDLFDSALEGRVTMLAEAYDAGSMVMLMEGVDPATATLDQMLAAIERIEEASRRGQFRRFTGNDYATDLAKGNVWASLAYSGDLVQLQSDNPNLRFAYPEEGAVLFTDNMTMPAGVEHPYAAETMMNYLYQPEVAAELTIWVNYISPVNGVQEILLDKEPEIAENPLIFPPDDVRARLTSYPVFSPEEERTMHEAMAKVTGG